ATVSGTVRGRMPHPGSFVVDELRFDYPRPLSSYPKATDCAPTPQKPVCPVRPPTLANDASFAFSLTGPEPTSVSGLSYFQWTISSGQAPLSYIDTASGAGLATSVYAYSSPRHQSLVFSSVTGANSLLQADPAVLTSSVNGIQAYR